MADTPAEFVAPANVNSEADPVSSAAASTEPNDTAMASDGAPKLTTGKTGTPESKDGGEGDGDDNGDSSEEDEEAELEVEIDVVEKAVLTLRRIEDEIDRGDRFVFMHTLSIVVVLGGRGSGCCFVMFLHLPGLMFNVIIPLEWNGDFVMNDVQRW